MLDNFSSFLVFPISRFHPVLGTAAPCNLPRITVEGGNRMLGSELHLLDLTDIWPRLTSCFLSFSPSYSWASSHLAFEQTETSSYQLSAVMIRYFWDLVVQVCIYFSSYFSERLSYTLMIFAVLCNCRVSISRTVPFKCGRASSKYLKCWRGKNP